MEKLRKKTAGAEVYPRRKKQMKERCAQWYLELHEIHRIEVLLLHVYSAHAVTHAARLLVLVLAPDDFFVLLRHLKGEWSVEATSGGQALKGRSSETYTHGSFAHVVST
jgi:hypothetical protein